MTKRTGSEMACSLPSLNPFDPSIVKLIADKGELKCGGKSFTELKNGRLKIVDNNSGKYMFVMLLVYWQG